MTKEEREKLKKDSNRGAIYGLSKGYIELNQNLSYYQDKLNERRLFILGIVLGVFGNLLASYLIELHFLLFGQSIYTISSGLAVVVIALILWQYWYNKKTVKPLKTKITELESALKDVKEVIKKIESEK